MPKPSRFDRLDQALQVLLASPAGGLQPSEQDPAIAPLLAIAQNLRSLPRESFKARLKSDLERKTSMATQTPALAAVRQTATPRLRIKNAPAAIEFYKQAFGATELMRFATHRRVHHAEIAIGNSIIFVGEEALDYGFPSPQSLGGSPVTIQLDVDDVDALVKQAVAAGARLVSPVQDQFYGERSGSVADPFGYTWGISTHKEDMPTEEMHRRFEQMEQQSPKPGVDPIRKGFRTLTPYLKVQDVSTLVDFLKQTFGAEETFRAVGSAGGYHCEVRIEDSMLMIGGGGAGLSWRGESQPMALHVYVRDTDAAYQRAVDAGAESLQPPADQFYGERTAVVKDALGNLWYIATAKGENYFSEGAPIIQPYLHPLRAEPVIKFLERAFGAQELGRHQTPEGVIHHTTIKIGNSQLEMSEAQEATWLRPMQSTFFLYVPNVDVTYLRALNAGATSTGEPADQPYGDRTAGVKDAFGNTWYLATHIAAS